MIDLKTLQDELVHARHARICAQHEGSSIEEIVGLMRQPWGASMRLDLAMHGDLDEPPAAISH
jgi:hypothetical protein